MKIVLKDHNVLVLFIMNFPNGIPQKQEENQYLIQTNLSNEDSTELKRTETYKTIYTVVSPPVLTDKRRLLKAFGFLK